jgi:exonuclease SbcC
MQLIAVELENIKRYKSARFDFPEGIIAIAGQNGAGKTTILEAIGYAIFGYLPYKQEDFIRRGQKNGTVQVTIRSPLDERLYTVFRSCQGQYYVYDPELKTKAVEQKADVQRWLRAHLGLAPTTDLENLFVAAVGVPQGTFTADFLKAAGQRKKVFDPLLQVESYKDAADKLNDTVKVLMTERAGIDRHLAGAQARLADLTPFRQKVIELQQERDTTLAQLAAHMAEKTSQTEALQAWDARSAAIEALKQQLTMQEAGLGHLQQQVTQTDDQVRQASEAATVVQAHQSDHDAYVAAQASVAQLEPKLQERKDQEEAKQALTGQQVKFATLLETLKQQMADLIAAEAERKALQPALEAWLALENEGKALAERERQRTVDRQAMAKATEQVAALQGRLNQAEQELAALAPQTAAASSLPERQQIVQTLQAGLQQLMEKQAARQATEQQAQSAQKALDELAGQIPALQADVERLKALTGLAEELPARQAKLADQLHAVGASKARAASLEEWQGRLAGGTCPFLAATCLNLADGQSLDQALGVTLSDAQAAITTAETGVAALQSAVAEAQQAATALAGLPEAERRLAEQEKAMTGHETQLREATSRLQTLDQDLAGLSAARQALAEAETALLAAQTAAVVAAKAEGVRNLQTELRQQLTQFEAEIAALHQRLAGVAELDGDLTRYQSRLTATTDPRPRVHTLDAKLAERQELEARIGKGEAMVTEVAAKMAAVTTALAESEGLVTAMTVARERLETHAPGYQKVLQYQVLARSLQNLLTEAATLKQRLDEATATLASHRQLLTEQSTAYDPAAHAACRQRLAEVTAELERLGERQKHLDSQLGELHVRIRQLEDLQVQSEEWLLQQTELDRIGEFLETGRSALRDAGPRLTQAYLASISGEANRLYREITGQGAVDLRWADDYEILLTENGHDRSFANLSGGEQMAASLAVRLALLKEVSSLDIAFFDEPTTNLDEERRRNLAKQLPQVKGFRQLVVISHDDTFEEVTDHVLRVDEATDLVLG